MRTTHQLAAGGLALLAIAAACTKAPYTGRVQYNLVPNAIMRPLGKTTYTAMLAESKVAKKGEDATMLSKVGKRISRVANEPKFDWQYSLIDDDAINAWCLPGGYIGFYTGILPVLKNESGMAFVMGHEVGHATAGHGAERLSQQLTVFGGLVGLELYLKDHSKLTNAQRGLLYGVLGVGATVGVLLPFSRMHESEADVIGLMMMSKAGYVPEESVSVWDRMEKMAGGNPLPAFLSTHPSNKSRKKNLREWMPKATKRFERNKLDYDTKTTLWTAAEGDKGKGKKSKHPAHGGD